MDPTSLQRLPGSEFRKRRAYWQLVRKAENPRASNTTDHPVAPGVTVERHSDLPSDAVILEN